VTRRERVERLLRGVAPPLLSAREEGAVVRRRVEVAPHLVELDQPAEERRFLDARDVAGQDLRQVVVGVDEAGQNHLSGRVDPSIDREPGRHGRRSHRQDAVVLDQHVAAREAALRVVHRHHQPRVVDERDHWKNS